MSRPVNRFNMADTTTFQLDVQEQVDNIMRQVDREAFRQLLLQELKDRSSTVTQAVFEIAQVGYCR